MKKYYAPDLKARIVRSYLGGKTITELASENKISRSTIHIWIKEAQSKEDKKIKGNTKEIRWTFSFNKSKIQENKPYKIIYVITISIRPVLRKKSFLK